MENKSELIYTNDGKYLTLPKEGNASLLFLEWLAYENFSPSPIIEILDGNLKDKDVVIRENVISVKFEDSNHIYSRCNRYITDNL